MKFCGVLRAAAENGRFPAGGGDGEKNRRSFFPPMIAI